MIKNYRNYPSRIICLIIGTFMFMTLFCGCSLADAVGKYEAQKEIAKQEALNQSKKEKAQKELEEMKADPDYGKSEDIQMRLIIKGAILNAQADDGIYEELKSASTDDTLTIILNNDGISIQTDTLQKYAKAIANQLSLDNEQERQRIKTEYRGGVITFTVHPKEDGSVDLTYKSNGYLD